MGDGCLIYHICPLIDCMHWEKCINSCDIQISITMVGKITHPVCLWTTLGTGEATLLSYHKESSILAILQSKPLRNSMSPLFDATWVYMIFSSKFSQYWYMGMSIWGFIYLLIYNLTPFGSIGPILCKKNSNLGSNIDSNKLIEANMQRIYHLW